MPHPRSLFATKERITAYAYLLRAEVESLPAPAERAVWEAHVAAKLWDAITSLEAAARI